MPWGTRIPPSELGPTESVDSARTGAAGGASAIQQRLSGPLAGERNMGSSCSLRCDAVRVFTRLAVEVAAPRYATRRRGHARDHAICTGFRVDAGATAKAGSAAPR
jgi:hypothetical protein